MKQLDHHGPELANSYPSTPTQRERERSNARAQGQRRLYQALTAARRRPTEGSSHGCACVPRSSRAARREPSASRKNCPGARGGVWLQGIRSERSAPFRATNPNPNPNLTCKQTRPQGRSTDQSQASQGKSGTARSCHRRLEYNARNVFVRMDM